MVHLVHLAYQVLLARVEHQDLVVLQVQVVLQVHLELAVQVARMLYRAVLIYILMLQLLVISLVIKS
jgi:hypothetical protein